MNETNANNSTSASSWAIPVAIVAGFGMIAFSIYLSNQPQSGVVRQAPEENTAGQDLKDVAPVTADDHIRGNPNAPLVIVEYSDYDCPFCKSYHVTMQKIIEEYGPSGKVAWVYRHYPLTSLHPSAALIAEASECVSELGGNEAFWKFTDMVFGERGTNELTNLTLLPGYAEELGLSRSQYEGCMESGRHREKVMTDLANAQAIGAQGTPHSVILTADQEMVIQGAQSYEQVKLLIDGLVD